MESNNKIARVRSRVKHTQNTKVTLTFSKELYAEVEVAARADDRAIANWVMRAAKEKLERMGM